MSNPGSCSNSVVTNLKVLVVIMVCGILTTITIMIVLRLAVWIIKKIKREQLIQTDTRFYDLNAVSKYYDRIIYHSALTLYVQLCQILDTRITKPVFSPEKF